MTTPTNGRGAWPANGIGGTLRKGDQPGPYYMMAEDPMKQIGLKTYCLRAEQQPVNVNYNATFHGVVAIQFLASGYTGMKLNGDGIFGAGTDKVIREVQKRAGITVDGIVGRNTMKVLLDPVIKARAAKLDEPWEPVYGILRYEGALDPGAVGYLDMNDLGLAQINTPAHPHVSFAQAFCASFAVEFVAKYLRYSLDNLEGNLRDAVASYNLGIGGTRQWIGDGRPDVWTPPWAVTYGERKINNYIDRILNAYIQD